MSNKIYLRQHVNLLKLKAAQKHNICPEKCHIGHVLLQGLLERPNALHQIDTATDERETNISVARRSMRLASAMNKYSLRPGDAVIIMGYSHLDLCIPFYACHYNGYAMCAIDPGIVSDDLRALFPYVRPKMVICQNSCVEKVQDAFKFNNLQGEIVTFDDKNTDLEAFIRQHKGTDANFKPAEFDHEEMMAWLMLTSGTTGLPKVAMIPFGTLLRSICCWWEQYTEKFDRTIAMATLQWVSSLIFFVSGPLRGFTRLQSSTPMTPAILMNVINKYKPNATAWTPFLLRQFLVAAENGCDLSSFKTIAIGGSSIEKPILERFRKICPAYLYLVYGMTELMVPVFNFNDDTLENSTGTPSEKYQFKLIDEEGNVVDKPFKSGELWIKGDDFFKGYLNNPVETRKILTDDGWFMTGDIFYRDDRDYYFFVDRKRLLIRHYGFWIQPLQIEEVIKTHPGVSDACVVGIPDPDSMERPVGAIMRRNGDRVDPEEIFELIRKALPDTNKRLRGGIFFVDSFPTTPSGKIHRAKVRELALKTPTILPK